jgi:hypothetical protein
LQSGPRQGRRGIEADEERAGEVRPFHSSEGVLLSWLAVRGRSIGSANNVDVITLPDFTFHEMGATGRRAEHASDPDERRRRMTEEEAIDRLKEHLNQFLNSPITKEQRDKALRLLAIAWDAFKGSGAESTDAYKLHRAESLHWQPPTVKFVLERHGGTARGSTRADLHYWEVDLDKREAGIVKIGWRKAKPKKQP